MATSIDDNADARPHPAWDPAAIRTEDVEAWNPEDLTSPPCLVTPERPHRAGMVATPYGDLYFLNVSGSMEEMATQLGRRMRDEAKLGAVPYFANYLEHVLENSPLKRISGAVDWATQRLITRRLKANVPKRFQDAIEAYARALDIPVDTLYRAYLMPETFLWLLGTYHRLRGTDRAHGLGAPPMFGCTSAITVPPRSQAPLHGRNFDYFGPDYWDAFPTVAFYHPDDGLDYVAVASAGFFGGGITSMNAAGLTFVVHQHFPDVLDLEHGVPVGVAGDQVMREAHTIEEAVRILRQHPPVAGWTYVMCEGDTGRAAIFEVAPGCENLTWIDEEAGQLGYANVYWGEALREVEVDYYPEYRRCNYARQDRVGQCLIDLGEGTTPREIARILGDLHDPETGQERLMGPTITSVMTVASVVFEPAERRIWVAAGKSPTCRNWFIPFSLSEGRPDMSTRPFIPYPGWQESPSGKAFHFYREATIKAQDPDTSDEKLLILMEHALALQPDEPYLRVVAGLIALRLGRGRRAEGAFRRALESIERADRRAEIGLFLAWSLDLQGQRGAARHLYKRVLADPASDAIVESRASHGRWFRFAQKDASALNIDFTYGGVP